MDNVYFIITTSATKRLELDADGNPVEVTIPAGTVVNRVLWDGETAWEPGEGLRVVLAE